MRVIAGSLKGRILRAPRGRDLRPTQGQVRKVLFDIVGDKICGARVLDLFAGSGAIGLEALSRGASEACFVERSRAALRCLRENVEGLGVDDQCRILAVPVGSALRILEEGAGAYRWIFSDPPYHSKPEVWIARVTRSGPEGLLAANGTLVLEVSRRQVVAATIGRLRRYRTHLVGETSLEFYGWEGRADGAQGDFSRDL